jgi:hypothetical protein
VFFNQNWDDIGTRLSFDELVSSITEISKIAYFKQACIAQKMSWASKRKTTRVEDMLYCLMRLFGVNMSILYGEGERLSSDFNLKFSAVQTMNQFLHGQILSVLRADC